MQLAFSSNLKGALLVWVKSKYILPTPCERHMTKKKDSFPTLSGESNVVVGKMNW